MDGTREVGDNIQAIQTATRENITRVEDSARAADFASEKANLSGETLEEIVALVASNASPVSSIASASEEQSAATGEMSSNMEKVNEIATRTVSKMAKAMVYTNDLTKLAEETHIVFKSL